MAQQVSVAVPFGWKRIIQDDNVTYVSPTDCHLNDLDEVVAYLQSSCTCKCGLECPLVVNEVFVFNPGITSTPWSPVNNTNNATNFCNHKRKIMAMAAFQKTSISPLTMISPTGNSKSITKRRRAKNKHKNTNPVLVSQMLTDKNKAGSIYNQEYDSLHPLEKGADSITQENEIIGVRASGVNQSFAAYAGNLEHNNYENSNVHLQTSTQPSQQTVISENFVTSVATSDYSISQTSSGICKDTEVRDASQDNSCERNVNGEFNKSLSSTEQQASSLQNKLNFLPPLQIPSDSLLKQSDIHDPVMQSSNGILGLQQLSSPLVLPSNYTLGNLNQTTVPTFINAANPIPSARIFASNFTGATSQSMPMITSDDQRKTVVCPNGIATINASGMTEVIAMPTSNMLPVNFQSLNCASLVQQNIIGLSMPQTINQALAIPSTSKTHVIPSSFSQTIQNAVLTANQVRALGDLQSNGIVVSQVIPSHIQQMSQLGNVVINDTLRGQINSQLLTGPCLSISDPLSCINGRIEVLPQANNQILSPGMPLTVLSNGNSDQQTVISQDPNSMQQSGFLPGNLKLPTVISQGMSLDNNTTLTVKDTFSGSIVQENSAIQGYENASRTTLSSLPSTQMQVPFNEANSRNPNGNVWNQSLLKKSDLLTVPTAMAVGGTFLDNTQNQQITFNNVGSNGLLQTANSQFTFNPPMPPLSVPNVTSLTTSITQAIPAVGITSQLLGQAVPTIQPFLQVSNSVPIYSVPEAVLLQNGPNVFLPTVYTDTNQMNQICTTSIPVSTSRINLSCNGQISNSFQSDSLLSPCNSNPVENMNPSINTFVSTENSGGIILNQNQLIVKTNETSNSLEGGQMANTLLNSSNLSQSLPVHRVVNLPHDQNGPQVITALSQFGQNSGQLWPIAANKSVEGISGVGNNSQIFNVVDMNSQVVPTLLQNCFAAGSVFQSTPVQSVQIPAQTNQAEGEISLNSVTRTSIRIDQSIEVKATALKPALNPLSVSYLPNAGFVSPTRTDGPTCLCHNSVSTPCQKCGQGQISPNATMQQNRVNCDSQDKVSLEQAYANQRNLLEGQSRYYQPGCVNMSNEVVRTFGISGNDLLGVPNVLSMVRSTSNLSQEVGLSSNLLQPACITTTANGRTTPLGGQQSTWVTSPPANCSDLADQSVEVASTISSDSSEQPLTDVTITSDSGVESGQEANHQTPGIYQHGPELSPGVEKVCPNSAMRHSRFEGANDRLPSRWKRGVKRQRKEMYTWEDNEERDSDDEANLQSPPAQPRVFNTGDYVWNNMNGCLYWQERLSGEGEAMQQGTVDERYLSKWFNEAESERLKPHSELLDTHPRPRKHREKRLSTCHPGAPIDETGQELDKCNLLLLNGEEVPVDNSRTRKAKSSKQQR